MKFAIIGGDLRTVKLAEMLAKDENQIYLYGLENNVLFILNKNGKTVKRFEVENFYNEEVLQLCEKLCQCKFESIKKMLSDNWFYKNIIG